MTTVKQAPIEPAPPCECSAQVEDLQVAVSTLSRHLLAVSDDLAALREELADVLDDEGRKRIVAQHWKGGEQGHVEHSP